MKNDTKVALAFVGVIVLLFGVRMVQQSGTSLSSSSQNTAEVFEESGVQVIAITAQGGYTPRRITARAGVPTVLRVTTKKTYDCSSSLVIPRLGFSQTLAPTGIQDISVSAEDATGVLQGMCGMGMYTFDVTFSS